MNNNVNDTECEANSKLVYFLMNIVGCEFVTPANIAPNAIIRQADHYECDQIFRYTKSWPHELTFWSHHSGPDAKGKGYAINELPKIRSYIIEQAGGTNVDMTYLCRNSILSICPLEEGLCFGVINGGDIIQMNSGSTSAFFMYHSTPRQDHDIDCFRTITPTGLDDIISINDKVKKFTHPELDLKNSINMYHELRRLPRDSKLRLLGIFAIIESVLACDPFQAHANKISRQIVNKTRLLLKRFNPVMLYDPYQSLDHDEMWTKLYKLRSCIAHGSHLNFDDQKQLQLLSGFRFAISYLDLFVRSLLRHVLFEPDLVVDLRLC